MHGRAGLRDFSDLATATPLPLSPCKRLSQVLRKGIAKNMPEATWKPHEKHGHLTMQSDLPDSVYAFPKQRKEPLTDAQHVHNAVARFDQSYRRLRCGPCFGVREHRESCKITTTLTSRKRVMARSGSFKSEVAQISTIQNQT